MLDGIASELAPDRQAKPVPEPAVLDYASLRASIGEQGVPHSQVVPVAAPAVDQ